MTFSGDIEKHRQKVLRRARFVARTAALETFNESRLLRSKGGRMPLDTGFLRASSQARIGSIPSGPTQSPSPNKRYGENEQASGQPVEATIIRWIPERDRLYFGFTANYARWMEAKYGYVRGAAENWNKNVRSANKRARSEIR